MRRELSDADLRDQVEALLSYVRRGGGASRWLDSKGFRGPDRAALLLALSDADEPDSRAVLADIARGVAISEKETA